MTPRLDTTKIIIHHTLTKSDCTIEEITHWHKLRGFSTIGYHYVIQKDGTVLEGRQLNLSGAHAKGRNANSVGIALCGDFSVQIPLPAQLDALNRLIDDLGVLYDLPLTDKYYDVVEYHRTGDNPCPGENFVKIFENRNWI